MKNRIVSLLLAALVLLAFAGCMSAEGEGAETAPVQDAAQDTAEIVLFDYSGRDENGEVQCIPELCAEYDITLVNFWATWCGPCVREIPELQRLYEEQRANGIGVIGIWIDTENPADKAAVLENAGATYPILSFDEAMGESLDLQYIPVSIFLDNEGRMIGEPLVGARGEEEWLSEAESRRDSLNFE